MDTPEHSSPSILKAAKSYWSERRSENGFAAATKELCQALWGFARDSTPARLRSRFGDADYDWEHRVNTTSGAVNWRDRFLGAFHSPYQPTEPALFHEMVEQFRQQSKVDLSEFTFVDLGSGKGRTLLMASHYPFRRIVGVELLPSLHRIAMENLARYKSEKQRCLALESVCADATRFAIPDGPVLIYLFNPFPEPGLRRFLANLRNSLQARPRPACLLYHNPELEHVIEAAGFLKKIAGTHQYSVFEALC